jgi:hypothetical protein
MRDASSLPPAAPSANRTDGRGAAGAAGPDRRKGAESGASKLEFLIVCRYEKLSSEEQVITRTASIIGTSFTADVLNSAIPDEVRGCALSSHCCAAGG